MKLSKKFIDSIGPAEKPFRVFDGRGLYLEVSPAGGKWWRFKYRFNGKEKRLSLGTYPTINLSEARLRTLEMKKLLSRGIDPSQDRRKIKAMNILPPDVNSELDKLKVLDSTIGSQQMTIQVTSIIYFVEQTIKWVQGDASIVDPCVQINFFYESNK